MSKANQARAGAHNRRLIVQLLRRDGTLSRRQLAEMTGLRSSTLTYIVRDLIERNVVRTVGKRASSSVGKKQVLLEVNPELSWAVGVGIGSDWVSLTFLDAAGGVMGHDGFNIGHDFDEVVENLKQYVQSWAQRQDALVGDLSCVGVGVPGVVDSDEGVMLRSIWFAAEDIPFDDLVSQAFGVPARIDNNVNFAALAESRVGSAQDLDNFMLFHLNMASEGDHYVLNAVGTALQLDGKLYRGAHYGAGEVNALLMRNNLVKLSAAELLSLSNPDDEMSDNMRLLGVHVASTLAVAVDMIDPDAVILGGNSPITNRRMLKVIEDEVSQRVVALPNRKIEVRASELLDHGVAMGAAISATDATIDSLLSIEGDDAQMTGTRAT